MFDEFSKWDQLRSFNIMDTSDNVRDERNFIRVMSMGCLSSVTELGVSEDHISEEMTKLLVHLETLRISGYGGGYNNSTALLHISNAVQNDLFPALRTVCIAGDPGRCKQFDSIIRMAGAGVSYHMIVHPPNPFCTYSCVVCHEQNMG